MDPLTALWLGPARGVQSDGEIGTAPASSSSLAGRDREQRNPPGSGERVVGVGQLGNDVGHVENRPDVIVAGLGAGELDVAEIEVLSSQDKLPRGDELLDELIGRVNMRIRPTRRRSGASIGPGERSAFSESGPPGVPGL